VSCSRSTNAERLRFTRTIDGSCSELKYWSHHIAVGLVLGALYAGGYLMSQNEITAGDLMSFMVATQTIQR